MSIEIQTPPNLNPPHGTERPAPGSDEDAAKADSNELLDRIKRRYGDGESAWEENKRLHGEDLNFVYNAETQGQWDPVVLSARRGKPSYTFNRVLGPVNMVVADMRQTRPAGKVRPTNQLATEAVADILAGICRSIEDESRASVIYKTQFKFAVAGGYGAWRIMPAWPEDDSDGAFDQVLRIMDIPNPQTVVWDPECNDPCAGDAMWGMIGDRISKDKHRALYPNQEDGSFQMQRDSAGWFTSDEVRVVDYFERVPYTKEIALLSNGRVVDYTPEQKQIDEHLDAHKMTAKDGVARTVRTRKVLKWRVMWVKCNGATVLEGPVYYDWKRIPIVRVPGRYINIEGRKKVQSLVRHSKDAQRAYNSRQSDTIERSALIPKAPYMVTQAMVRGFENEWAQANTQSRPYLPYNIDEKAAQAGVEGGGPTRVPPIDMPEGSIALAEQAISDIQATTGFFDPALGNADQMNRVSGKALVQHTRRSDLGSYEFIDGFQDALQLTWEMLIDMIPTVYDTERVVRVMGNDEVEKMVTVNQQSDDSQVINDLKKGAYSCKVTIGPSYQTARQEMLATLIDASSAIPAIGQMCPDILTKNIDSPDAEEMAQRMRIGLIRQGLIKPTPADQENMPSPPPPNPVEQANTMRALALARRDGANATIAEHKVDMLPLNMHDQIVAVAGRELANMIAAQKLGNPNAATAAEASAAQSSAPQPAAP